MTVRVCLQGEPGHRGPDGPPGKPGLDVSHVTDTDEDSSFICNYST